MKRVYVDGQNFLYKAAEVLIEHGKISSKDELTKIDIRSLVENIVGVGVEIVFYGARVQVRRDLDDSILEKTTRFSDVARRLRNTLKNQNITFNEVGKLKVRDSDVCHNCQHKDLRMQEKGVDVWTAVQAYNFGPAYIDFIAQNGKENTLALAKQYSRETVAPILGNTTGKTYTYINPISIFHGAELYVNGGNYYYSRQVRFNLYIMKFFNFF